MDPALLDRGVLLALSAATALCLAVGLAVFSERVALAARGLLARVSAARVRGAGDRLLTAVRNYSGHRSVLAAVLGTSLAVQPGPGEPAPAVTWTVSASASPEPE